MNNFAYGIAFNLTLMRPDVGTPAEWEALGLKDVQRRTFLDMTYVLKEDKYLKGYRAEYQYASRTTDNRKVPYSERFRYSADLEKAPKEVTIGLARNKMQSAWKVETDISRTKWSKRAGAVAGGLAAYATYDSSLQTLALTTAASAVTIGFGLGRAVKYARAVDCFDKQFMMNAVVNGSKKSIEQVQQELQEAKDKPSFLTTMGDRFIKGRPGDDKLKVLQLNAEDHYLNNLKDLFTPYRLQQLHALTENNLNRNRFDIRYLPKD